MGSNIYEWIGGSVDAVLNSYVQLMAHSVIDDFWGLFVLGGGLFFMTLGLLSVGGSSSIPFPSLQADAEVGIYRRTGTQC